MYRSTKGASKARRDQINAEIRNLKDLLPISDVDKARLSYLHIMSLACMYTRKSVFFSKDAPTTESPEESFFSFHELSELMHEMPGFLLLLTGEGKMLFLSDSVSEHLGHSMVDLVAQGDSVYDIIDPTDHFIMRSNLVPPTTAETDRLFRCRFNTSKSVRRQSAGNKLVVIRARCLSPPAVPTSPPSYWTSNPVWVCFCTPLEPHPPRPGTAPEPESSRQAAATESNLFLACFFSQHSRDMRLQEAQDSVSDYLGLDVETLRARSWYSLLHPQDLTHASAQHCSLLREGGEGRAEMVVRVEAANHSWVWLYMVLQLEAGEHPIRSNNFVISESEAWSVRQQLSSEQTQLTLVLGSSSTSQQEGTSLQSPETLSSPDQVFTPGSSGLSGQSFDFSTAVCSEEPSSSSKAAEPGPEGEGPRSSLSSLEEESFFQQPPASSEPLASPSAASSPIPVTVATVPELDFLTQNILLPPSFQLEPPVPALPLPLPPVPTTQAQQTKEFVCTPPYTPQVGSGSNFPFGDPLFSFDPTGTTTPSPGPVTATITTSTGSTTSPGNPPSSPPPPHTTTLSTLLPLSLTAPSTELLFPVDPCSGTLYEKLPPTPDSPGDGDCTVMTLPEVRGPLFVDVPLGPLHCPPEGMLTPEASPGKQPYLSFFSLEPERERERMEKMEISLLAEHIVTLAEGLYPEGKLTPSSEPPSPTTQDPVGLDSLFSLLGDFYPIKFWRGLDLPIFPDEDALFEERMLENLLQDLATSPCPSPASLSSSSLFSSSLSSSSSSPSTSSAPSSLPSSPTSPMCWHPSLHFDGASAVGASHFCSVQSARRNQAAGCGAATERAPTPRDQVNCEEEAEVAMETEESPLLSSGVPMSPPLVASSVPASPPPVSPVQPGLLCAQSLLEELAALEPMFGAGASITPGLGQQPELYQLQRRPMPQCFHKDGSGSDPPF